MTRVTIGEDEGKARTPRRDVRATVRGSVKFKGRSPATVRWRLSLRGACSTTLPTSITKLASNMDNIKQENMYQWNIL